MRKAKPPHLSELIGFQNSIQYLVNVAVANSPRSLVVVDAELNRSAVDRSAKTGSWASWHSLVLRRKLSQVSQIWSSTSQSIGIIIPTRKFNVKKFSPGCRIWIIRLTYTEGPPHVESVRTGGSLFGLRRFGSQ